MIHWKIKKGTKQKFQILQDELCWLVICIPIPRHPSLQRAPHTEDIQVLSVKKTKPTKKQQNKTKPKRKPLSDSTGLKIKRKARKPWSGENLTVCISYPLVWLKLSETLKVKIICAIRTLFVNQSHHWPRVPAQRRYRMLSKKCTSGYSVFTRRDSRLLPSWRQCSGCLMNREAWESCSW